MIGRQVCACRVKISFVILPLPLGIYADDALDNNDYNRHDMNNAPDFQFEKMYPGFQLALDISSKLECLVI